MLCVKSINCKTNSMIILGIILLILGSLISIVIIINEQIDGISSASGFFSGIFIIAGVGFINDAKCPQAIDVYRDKTTLQITYKGNIPIDTTVVYK